MDHSPCLAVCYFSTMIAVFVFVVSPELFDASRETIATVTVFDGAPAPARLRASAYKTPLCAADAEESETCRDSYSPCVPLDSTTRWCRAPDSTARLNATSGNVTRRTRLGTERRLAGKHVVMIGDSRTRYQYMALVHFLARGRWPRCKEAEETPIDESSCYFVDEKHGGGEISWLRFFVNTSRALNDAPGRSETCDCHRPVVGSMENRFFSGPNYRVTFLQSWHAAIGFHASFPPFNWNASSIECAPGYCDAAPTLLSMRDALDEIVPRLNATHVFVNSGWENLDMGCLVSRFAARNPGVEAYAMSNPDERSHPSAAAPPLGCGARLFDRRAATRDLPTSLYWDGLHILSSANEELNHLMIDLIG